MITKVNLDIDTNEMLYWINTLHDKFPSGRGSGNPRGAQYTVPQYKTCFEPLIKLIKEVASYHSHEKFSITDIWVNYSPPGCINGKHKHDDADIAGCYYLVVPEDSGSIQFETGQELTPNPGDFLYWNADIVHWVNKNESSETRISVAFNIKYHEPL